MKRVRYLNSQPGFDRKIGQGVIKDGIYEVPDELADKMANTTNYEIVNENKVIEEEPKKLFKRKVKDDD